MTAPSRTPAQSKQLEALLALAQQEFRAGRLPAAVAACHKILAIRPIAEVHDYLGVILVEQGQLDEAVAQFRRALALKPAYTQAHVDLANALLRQGNFAASAAHFEQALTLSPHDADVHNSLGIVLAQQGKPDQATAQFERALALRPNFPEAHNNLGGIFWKQGQLDEAAARYEQALALRPDYAEAHTNLGNVLARQGKLDQAAARCQQAIALNPGGSNAHKTFGDVLMMLGQLDECTAQYEQALALNPTLADAWAGLSTCYLVKGDYERGWPAFEARLRVPGVVPLSNLPRWTGEPLAGRSLLLVTEQGLGDTIHFIRFARALKERGARVVLACPAALGRLLASFPDLDEVFIVGSTPDVPRCDFHLPLLSAPSVLGTTVSTIPCDIPYLAADAELTEHWRRELAGIDGFKIGIVWQGSRTYSMDRWRSIPLAQFAPLAALPGVQLISLQKGFGSEQLATVDFPVLDVSGRLDELTGPFMDTAAVIRNLDLVVTANTAIAHLAGALGAPVWLALDFSPDWRWLQDRDDTPWYPTMRLFRQTAFGQWPGVFERIAAAVQARRAEQG